MRRPGESDVRIGLVFPELLGTYGDVGNATVLARRLEWRGIEAEIVQIGIEDVLPRSCDIYVLGGAEDAAQGLARSRLDQLGLSRALDSGAVLFAVCAGLQILGRSFAGREGTPQSGLGLLDCTTRPRASRMIGELVVEPSTLDLPLLTGFENHGGITELGPGCAPLGRVMAGYGNGSGTLEGAVSGRVVGTYMHGPALARNPALADLLLSWVVGPLPSLDEPLIERLRGERLKHALG